MKLSRLRVRSIAFFALASMIFSLFVPFAQVAYAGTTIGSSNSINAVGTKNGLAGGMAHIRNGVPEIVFRVGISRDPGFYNNGDSDYSDTVKNFIHRYPKNDNSIFFAPAGWDDRNYYAKYSIAKYNASSRTLDEYNDATNLARLIQLKNAGSKPINKGKKLLSDDGYSFSGNKPYSQLTKGKWKTIASKISKAEAIEIWSWILDKTGTSYSVEDRIMSFISPYAKKNYDKLTKAEAEDVARGYIGLLMATWVLVPANMRAPWESGIEDYLLGRNQDKNGSPTTLLVDTAVTLTFTKLGRSIVMGTVDYFMYYTAVNAKWDIYKTTNLGSAAGNSYDMLKQIANQTIKEDGKKKINRTSDRYDANNVFSHASSAIAYPYRWFKTPGGGLGDWMQKKHQMAVLDALTFGKNRGNILGFVSTNFSNLPLAAPLMDPNADIKFTIADPPTEVEILPATNEMIGKPNKLVFTSNPNAAIISAWQKLVGQGNPNFPVRITFQRTANPAAKVPPSYSGGYDNGVIMPADRFMRWIRGEEQIIIFDDVSKEQIAPGGQITYTYKPLVEIQYNLAGQNEVLEISPAPKSVTYKRPPKPPIPITYTSKPYSFAEFKEGKPDEENFDAMSGVPSNKRLYLGVGGSEFIVDIELEYKKNVDSVWRTYRSYFSAVDSEHKLGDQDPVTHNYTPTPSKSETKTWPYGESKPSPPAWYGNDEVHGYKKFDHTASSDGKRRTGREVILYSESSKAPRKVCKDGDCEEIDGYVTWRSTVTPLSPHQGCGPECSYTLPMIEDTWKQRINFDYLKISRVEVYKIEEGRITKVDNVFGEGNEELKAKIVQGDPNIFVNIAQMNANGDDIAAQSSKHGRIRYSLDTLQHDTVVYYEGPRTNKSDGRGWNGTSFSSPIGQNHPNARGIVYTNPNYTTEKDYHITHSNDIDKARPEFQRFHQRRTAMNTATIISDMLILQTSSGDQSVIYFAKSSTPKQAQEQFDPVRATKEEMWDNNPYSAAKWSKDKIYIGSYNGNYSKTGYGSSNNRKYWGFDRPGNRFINNASGGAKIRIPTVFDNNGVGVNASIPRPPRPDKLYIYGVRDIVPTTPNGAYTTGDAEVFFRRILEWKTPNPYPEWGVPLAPHAYNAKPQENFDNKIGLVFPAPYSESHRKVNDIVIHTPVSVEDAMIISLPSERDQRTKLPPGSAEELIEEQNKLKVCPLDPALCEFRVLNCKYRDDIPLAYFDFEDIQGNKILNKETGAYIPFVSSPGIEIKPVSGFGDGKVLSAFGTRWSINFSDIGLTNDRNTRVYFEMDFYMPNIPQKGTMIVSFGQYDFYIPAGQGEGTWNTGNGWEKKTKGINFVGNKMKLGLLFSFGSVEDCELYVNGQKVTTYERVNESRDVNSRVGTTINIGSWSTNDDYPAAFYIDNLKIIRKGGTLEHTDSCYINTISHETQWIHVHDESCWVDEPPVEQVFNYTGSVQQFVVPRTGKYILEVWGASGGISQHSQTRSKGGYAKGEITLNKGQVLYIYVGGQGQDFGPNGGFNGGGRGYNSGTDSAGGGGATHIATQTGLLYQLENNKQAVLIVAGGGGGNGCFGDIGGNGGGLTGNNGIPSSSYLTAGRGGTQMNGGASGGGFSTAGTFGQGGSVTGGYGGGGGGGGWYGGGAGGVISGGGNAGGGGSGYIGGVQNGVTQTGVRTGHGMAKITAPAGGKRLVCNNLPLNTLSENNVHVHTADCLLTEMPYDTSNVPVGTTYDFNYTGNVQTFIAPATGVYKLEVWGAQGGSYSSISGGKGGYAKGTINLNKGEILYIYVGGKGGDAGDLKGGWNGGGSHVDGIGGGGGGATDIRKGGQTLQNRIIVAGGGGGASHTTTGGAGGGLSGESITPSLGAGTQTSGYALGQGGPAYDGDHGGGGGGGYYGGFGSQGNFHYSGGGGSGYIGGVQDGVTQSGVNSGNGKARITVVSVSGGSSDGLYGYTWKQIFGSNWQQYVTTTPSVQFNVQKMRQDFGKFPTQMPDGSPNPIFGCMTFIGEQVTNIGFFEGRTGSGVSIVKVKHPTSNVDVDAIRLNAGFNSPIITTDKLGLVKKARYTIEFDYWADADNVRFSVDLSGVAISGLELTAKRNVQHAKWDVSLDHSSIENAALRVYNDIVKPNPANIYITGVRVYLTPIPNKHEHTENCVSVKILACTEPHHYGGHYSGSSPICWDACGNDENHRHIKRTITLPDGSVEHLATFINLDYPFRVYFPNKGDFAQRPDMKGISTITDVRGMGYVNDMDTTEYTREKRIRFEFHVIYDGKLYRKGSWISLPVEQEYFDFYAVLANKEASSAMVDFEAIPINGIPTEDPQNENYIEPTNRERYPDYYALHGAYKDTYVDVVGRIGNFVVSDTEDFRFSNLFKQEDGSGEWLLEGFLKKVDSSRQNKYYGDIYDIRGEKVTDTGIGLNTYGSQKWLEQMPLRLPINPKDIGIEPLKEEFMKVGYDIFADISTIGNYQEGMVRALPYYFKLNLDTGVVTPLDVYMKSGDEYKLVNRYKGADIGVLPNDLYHYKIAINWDKESKRRNYTPDEAVITDRVAEVHQEYVLGPVEVEDGEGIETGVVATKRLTTPLGTFIDIGNAQRIVAEGSARTFIGSQFTYEENKNLDDMIEQDEWDYAAQRWHLKFGLPASSVFVPAGEEVSKENIDKVKQGNGVILMAVDIVSIGDLYVLRWDQPGISSFTVEKNGVSRTFDLRGSGLPPVIALYDLENTALVDITSKSSH